MLIDKLMYIPPNQPAECQLEYADYPPWACMWMALGMDVLCHSMVPQCPSWRDHVPLGLAEPGQCFSEEFEVLSSVTSRIPPDRLTFEQFRANQGLVVTEGSSVLAGVDRWQDLFSRDYFDSVYEYMFHTPSTAFSNLFTPTALWTLALLVLAIKAIKAYFFLPTFQRIGRRIALQTKGAQWAKDNTEKITKFSEYVYRLVYHSCISLVGCYYFWDAPWWNEDQGGTATLWTNYPYAPIAPGMSWYYLFQAAYNVDALLSLLQISFEVKLFSKHSAWPVTLQWSKTVRGDFNEMFVHHWVTNALVLMSSYFGFTRVGSMVFWMHDLSDIPVDLTKMGYYAHWSKSAQLAFATTMVMWGMTRLYVFPFVITASIYKESHLLVCDLGVASPAFFYLLKPAFLILLGILILLHVVWYCMFIKIAYTMWVKWEDPHDYTDEKTGPAASNNNGHAPTTIPAQTKAATTNGNHNTTNGTHEKKTM